MAAGNKQISVKHMAAGVPMDCDHKVVAAKTSRVVTAQKKIWIDLDNSPHVPFFAPIIHGLEDRGYSIVLTARDCFQVCDLADLFHFTYKRIGRHYGKHKLLKVIGTGIRALELLPVVWGDKPVLAVSHGSRSMLTAASMMGVPSVMIYDYEFAKFLPGLDPTWVMVPDVIPDSAIHYKSRVLKYPGIKEDVYVPTFKPDPKLRTSLGLNARTIVTLRPPADEAHYHNPESEMLLAATLELLSEAEDTQVILLPRNDRQGELLRSRWTNLFSIKKVVIPDHVVDGLNLIWLSDLVISGGGTMNREAAALGVPVYSIFRGTIGAVDRYLEKTGRLVLLQSVDDIRTKLLIKRRDRDVHTATPRLDTLNFIVEQIVSLVH